jgi:hypothetical protein
MIKLNIQRFSSTNKTTHYELSQYVSSDLPTYLVDYNSDMSKIDTGINTAQTTADTAATAATNAATAAETAQTTANTAVTNAATADNKAETAQTRIGTLANLTTTAKTDAVSAINEVDANCDSNASKIGTLANLETTTKTDLVSAINEVRTEEEGTLLWENPDITQGMAAQTLVQNASQYEYIKVIYNYGSNDNRNWEQICFKGAHASMIALVYFNGVYMRARDIEFTSAGAINIGAGEAMGAANTGACLPLKIVGFTKKYHN